MGDVVNPSDSSIHLPRWAAVLWRLFRGDEADYGDLVEAYRDSIYPIRGRLRADAWLLWQIAGCILRTNSTMNLGNWILAGLILCILTIVGSAIRYFQPNGHPDPHRLRNLIAISVGFLFYAYVAICRTRARSPKDELVLRLGAVWGLAIGAVWSLSYISGNLFRIQVVSPILLALVGFCLPFIAGAHGAIKIGKVSFGMRVGFWSGLISGLMAFLSLAAVGYILAFVPGLPGAEIPPAELYTTLDYERLNVFDALGGGIAHLFGFGGVFATLSGMLGGCAGILLERTGRIPDPSGRN